MKNNTHCGAKDGAGVAAWLPHATPPMPVAGRWAFPGCLIPEETTGSAVRLDEGAR